MKYWLKPKFDGMHASVINITAVNIYTALLKCTPVDLAPGGACIIASTQR